MWERQRYENTAILETKPSPCGEDLSGATLRVDFFIKARCPKVVCKSPVKIPASYAKSPRQRSFRLLL